MCNDDDAIVCGIYRREIFFVAVGDLILGFLVCGTPRIQPITYKTLAWMFKDGFNEPRKSG